MKKELLIFTIIFSILFILISGCISNDDNDSNDKENDNQEFGNPVTDLSFEIKLLKNIYSINESIYITAELRNIGSKDLYISPMSIEFLSSFDTLNRTLDFIITTPNNSTIQCFSPFIENPPYGIILKPNDSINQTINLLDYEFTSEYGQKNHDFSKQGEYKIQGVYNSEEAWDSSGKGRKVWNGKKVSESKEFIIE